MTATWIICKRLSYRNQSDAKVCPRFSITPIVPCNERSLGKEQILEAAVGWKFLFAIILLLLQKPLTDSKKLQGVKKELECNVRNTRNKNELFKIKIFSVEVFFSALSTVNVFTRQSSHSEIQKVVGCRERSAVNCPF